MARHEDWYEVELCEKGKAFIRRLKLKSGYGGRLARVTMESVYEDFEVIEILKEEYQGRPFGGLEWVDVSFAEIEVLVRNGVGRWSGPLENVKGVYLITDTLTGKRYVGSAYGEWGVWGRWRQYAWTGHGGKSGMQPIVLEAGIEYCRANFRFALLESHPFRVSDDLILKREGFWKDVLHTRGEGGLNRN